MVIGTLGAVPKYLNRHLKTIGIDKISICRLPPYWALHALFTVTSHSPRCLGSVQLVNLLKPAWRNCSLDIIVAFE